MMSVQEYANDVNKSVEEILKKCMELGINVKNASDELDEDAIIELDNATYSEEEANTETTEETSVEE